MQIVFLRELTPSIIPTPPHLYRRTFTAATIFSLPSYCSTAGCQAQSLSELLIIKYYLLFLHLRKLQNPTNPLKTTVGGPEV